MGLPPRRHPKLANRSLAPNVDRRYYSGFQWTSEHYIPGFYGYDASPLVCQLNRFLYAVDSIRLPKRPNVPTTPLVAGFADKLRTNFRPPFRPPRRT